MSIVACRVEISAKSGGDRYVRGMFRERPGEAGGHVNHELRRITLYSVDPLGEVQRRLGFPYFVVPLRRQDGRRIANRDPGDRDSRTRGKSCSQMENRMDADFCATLDKRAVKDRRARRNEDLILDRGADNMRHWPDQGVRAY